MKALVTGAAGFVGSHVVRALRDAGHTVRALHLPGERLTNLDGLDVERVAGDVTDAEAMRAAVSGCDWVFHLAAIYALWLRRPERMRRVNVEGTRTVLEAARAAGVGRVVVTSSIARFGGQGPGRRAREDSPYRLDDAGDTYAQSKFEAHELAVAYARDLDVVLVAPTGPIGPNDVGPTPTGRLLLATVTMPVAVVTESASNFADVRDIARGHVLAAERGRRGEAYLLGNRDLTLVELAELARSVTGRRSRTLVVSYPVARWVARAAAMWADRVTGRPPLFTLGSLAIAERELRADCSKAVRELGLPQSPLEDAIRDAFAWWRAHGYLA